MRDIITDIDALIEESLSRPITELIRILTRNL